ncbi:MAG: membrane protein insertase YidC [Nocardioides sp.]
METLGAIGHAIMVPLYWIISVVLVGFHRMWSTIFPAESGAAWVLSIVGLTLVIRAALIPLFVKQIKSSRNMQLIQPRVKELQAKFGHDRERMSQETMKLYRETGTNPFSSCLPILVQMPIFLALFRLIDQAAKNIGHGVLTTTQAQQFANAELFGIPIKSTFIRAGGDVGVIVLAGALVVAMIATTFTTQKQLMSKNMPAESLTGPFAQQQKIMLYVLPLVFGIGGIAFPIGVLVYWTTSNVWTMGQQFYVIRNNPAPNTPAAKAKAAREAKRRGGGLPATEADTAGTSQGDSGGGAGPKAGGSDGRQGNQRQQPKRKPRSQRKQSAKKPDRNGPDRGQSGSPN